MPRTPAPEAPQVPIAPMLDMAFNLLAFFVMTFNPAPLEVQYTMNLLPGQPQAKPDEAPSEEEQATSTEIPAALRTMTTSLVADPSGMLGRVTVGDIEVQGMAELKERLIAILADKTLPFDQALIQADPNLQYGELMQVIDIFNGQGITKISFAELNSNAMGLAPSL